MNTSSSAATSTCTIDTVDTEVDITPSPSQTHIDVITTDETQVQNPTSPKGNEKVIASKSNRSWLRRLSGIICAVLCSFFFTLVSLFVKQLNSKYHPITISFWRYLGHFLFSLPVLFYFRVYKKRPILDPISPWPYVKENWIHIRGLSLRGFLASTNVILRFIALGWLTLADFTVLSNSSSIFTIILAHFFLAEPCGLVPSFAAGWILIGVVIIVRPPILTGEADFDIGLLIGTGIALTAVFFQVITSILVRKMRKIHFSLLTTYSGLWGLGQGLILAFAFNVFSVPDNSRDIIYMFLVSLSGFVYQLFMILALKYEEAAIVSLIRSSDVVFAFLLQVGVLQMETDVASIMGACVVLTGVLIIGFRKWLSLRDEKTSMRRWFAFILR